MYATTQVAPISNKRLSVVKICLHCEAPSLSPIKSEAYIENVCVTQVNNAKMVADKNKTRKVVFIDRFMISDTKSITIPTSGM